MAKATPERTEFSAMLERAINASDKSQKDIAIQIGYDNANVLSMFKRGISRLPLSKVRPLAIALDADPNIWMTQWFEAYMPDCIEDVRASICEPLSRAEKSWLKGLRKLYGSKLSMFSENMIQVSNKS